MSRACLLICLLLGALIAPRAWARKEIADQLLEAATGSRIELAAVFDPAPPGGVLPIRVVARNGTAKAAPWRLGFQCRSGSHGYNSAFEFTVPAQSTETHVLMVPLAFNYQGNRYYSHNQVRIEFSAPGLGTHEFNDYSQASTDFPSIAIGKELADNALSRLESALDDRRKKASSYGGGSKVFGSRFLIEDLPEDWRALSGFDVVMLTNGEWSALKPGARLAVLQWVRLGGRLHLYTSPGVTAAELRLPREVTAVDTPLSLGALRLIPWDGKNLDAKGTVDRYWGTSGHSTRLAEQHTIINGSRPAWAILAALGERSFASWQVLVFLVLFGILVGPVNLYVLAPTSRRHRLFITTPLLSVGASVIMMVILLLQDGIGGVGKRLVTINLEPEEATAYVTQEQASRTGLLLSSSFENRPGSLVEPLALPDKPWVKLKSTHTSQATALNQQGATLSGNFFQSRTEQGQLIRSVLPSRARVELQAATAPDAPPRLVSALGFTLTDLFYVDPQGRVWKASGSFATGQPIELAASDKAELRKWWREARQPAGTRLRERLQDLEDQLPNRFFAKASAAPGFTVDTLKSIRWSDDVVLVFGTVPLP
jgi:hypothetical protein